MCQSGAICLSADCWFNEHYKDPIKRVWSSTKRTSSSSSSLPNVICPHHDMDEKKCVFCVKQQSLTKHMRLYDRIIRKRRLYLLTSYNAINKYYRIPFT